MSLSAQQITAKLALLQTLVGEWEQTDNGPTSVDTPVATSLLSGREGKDVIVAFRTRPPLDAEFTRFANERADEKDASEPVVLDADQLKLEFRSGIKVLSEEPGVMIAHVPGMKWNGPTLTQKKFEADLAFGPQSTNEHIYEKTVEASDMLNLVLGGGVGCVMAYGQTGAGKTYTMESMENFVARDIFKYAKVIADKRSAESSAPVSVHDLFEFKVTFLELLGKQARDLVGVDGDETKFESINIIEDKAGFVRPQLVETTVKDSAELQSVITASLAHRRTDATARNAQSSRSHAVLTIRVHNKLFPFTDDGEMILVDLAGSERYDDSKAHSKELMNQSRDNNKSLATLKECVRTRAKASAEDGVVHIPFRTNKLTLLLKSIFDLESTRLSKTVVIAHVSPHLQDTPHSVNTLSYAAPFLVNVPKSTKKPSFKENDPRTWDHQHAVKWLADHQTGLLRKKEFALYKVKEKKAKLANKTIAPFDRTMAVEPAIDLAKFCPEGCEGKNLVRWYTVEWMDAIMKAIVPNAKWSVADVKDVGSTLYADFTVMVLEARTKTRNTILKSRKELDENTTYGSNPYDEEIGTARASFWEKKWVPSDEELQYFEEKNFDRLEDARAKAATAAQEKGEDTELAKANVTKDLFEDWFQVIRMEKGSILGKRVFNIARLAKVEGRDPEAAGEAEHDRLFKSWLVGKEPEIPK